MGWVLLRGQSPTPFVSASLNIIM
jgi:Phosphotransferase enzyme family